MPEEPWTEVCDMVKEAVTKTIPKKKKCKKAKWLSEDALQIAVKRRETKKKKKNLPIFTNQVVVELRYEPKKACMFLNTGL